MNNKLLVLALYFAFMRTFRWKKYKTGFLGQPLGKFW